MDRIIPATNKTVLEQGWLDHMMRDDAEWSKCRSTHRIYVQKDQPLTVWQHGAPPTALGSAVVSDIRMSFEGGIELQVDDIIITSRPTRLAPGLFVWIPAFADIRYAPSEYADPRARRRMTVPVCLKSMSNPDVEPTKGAYYLSKQADFYASLRSQA